MAAAWTLPATYAAVTIFTGGELSPGMSGFFMAIALGITILHRRNIRRLIQGREKRLEWRR